MDPIIIVASIALWGTLCALVGPRKGFDPQGAFGIGAIFGPLGLIFLALRSDKP